MDNRVERNSTCMQVGNGKQWIFLEWLNQTNIFLVKFTNNDYSYNHIANYNNNYTGIIVISLYSPLYLNIILVL